MYRHQDLYRWQVILCHTCLTLSSVPDNIAPRRVAPRRVAPHRVDERESMHTPLPNHRMQAPLLNHRVCVSHKKVIPKEALGPHPPNHRIRSQENYIVNTY